MLYNKKEDEFIMSRQKTHHTKQFKLDAINYRKEHPDLTQVECAKNLGIGVNTLARWEAQFRDNDGDIPVMVPAVTLLMKQRKSPALSVSCVIHRMHLMC